MNWNVRPLNTTNVQAKNLQVQGLYQSQQPAPVFSQANGSAQNSSTYTGNDKSIKIPSSTGNIVANQLPSPNTMGFNNFQPPLVRTTVPVKDFGTTQHFVGLNASSHVQPPSMTVQMVPGMAKNVWPNSNIYTFSPVTSQHSTGNPTQQPQVQYIAFDMYNNHLQKNCSNTVQVSVFKDNKNSLHSNSRSLILPKYRPPNSQTNATVPLNQVSSLFQISQQNSSCLTFPSGQNIKNQINGTSSGSTIAVQSQQYTPNCAYSSSYSIPMNYVGQVTPQATNVNVPPPPKNPVPPAKINHEQLVPTQPVSNMPNGNLKNLMLDQSSVPYSDQRVQMPSAHVPIAGETNEVAGTTNDVHGHRAENQPSDNLPEAAVEVLRSLCNSLGIVDTLPLDKRSPPQTTRMTAEDNVAESSGNVLDRLTGLKSITRESLELDRQELCELKKKFTTLIATFKLKHRLYQYAAKKPRLSDPSVHSPNVSLPSCNTDQNQPGMLSPATHQTLPLASREATQNLASLLLHDDNIQDQSPPLSCSSNQIQDRSLSLIKSKSHLYPILQELLKGTSDEEMLLKIAGIGRNQNKQLFVSEKHSSGPPPVPSVSGTQNASKLCPKTSETVFTQEALTSSLGFEKKSTSNKDQLTNMSAVSEGGSSYHFVLNKNEVGSTTTEILTRIQNAVSVQNPTALSESLHRRGKAEVSEDFQNYKPEFKQQCKVPEKNIIPFNNGSDTSTSAPLATAIPEAAVVQKTSAISNSCTVRRTCSLEELETSLALWKKSPSASLSDQLGESTKSTMNSSSMVGVEDNKMQYTMKNFPSTLMHNERSSLAVGNSEAPPSSSVGQKLDAISSCSLKSSEPQVAIVSPLILSKEGMWNDEQEKNQSSVRETMFPVVEESKVFSLHELSLKMSDIDKSVERTAYSRSDTCVTVKKEHSDLCQKIAKATEDIGKQGAETGTNYSCDTLEMKKITPHLCPRDIFSLRTNNRSSSPVSPKCASESCPDLVKPEDTVRNDNMLQISSVCTLVQGDAFYNSQIASMFSTDALNSEVENNTSSKDCRPDSYHKEQRADLRKKGSEMHGDTPVRDAALPSIGTLSKAIAEKLLRLKRPQDGKDSHEMNIRNSERSSNSGKKPEQNSSCDDVYRTDVASGNQDVPQNVCLFSDDNENSTHSVREKVPANENQAHSLNHIEIALTLPNDQLTELVKEFPYGIDNSRALKKIKNEDSATELVTQEETQTSGQNSEANDANFEASDVLGQIKIETLTSQQMEELFPENSCQSPNNHLSVASADTNNLRRENESYVQSDQTILVRSTNTSEEMVKETVYCCIRGWLSSRYALDPCACMLDKEAALKQQFDGCFLSESISKEGPETDKNSNAHHRLYNQQQSTYPNHPPLEASVNRILDKTIVHGDCDFPETKCKPLKEGKEGIAELLDKDQIDEMGNQKCKTLVSVSQEHLFSRTKGLNGEFIGPHHRKELPDNQKTPRETVVDKSKKDSHHLRNMENKQSKKNERYKIKQDSSDTHIIKGPVYNLKKGPKQTATEKYTTFKRSCSTVTNSSNLSSIDSLSKMCDNVPYAQEQLSQQKCETERDLENNQAVRTEQNQSSSSEPAQQNKVNFNLKKFAYSEERGSAWKYRRSLSSNSRTSKVQIHRGQLLKIHKSYSSLKDPMWGTSKREKCSERTISDKNSPYGRKGNILTLQRDQKKNYLNKVAFRQTAESICLTKLEQSPSKLAWRVKSHRSLEYPEDPKKDTRSSQQPDGVRPQMLEFKMCPEPVFRNLVSEDVPDGKELPEKETVPVSAVKSKREDWLQYSPLKRRKTEEKKSEVFDHIPLDAALELLEKNEAADMPVKTSNATFQTYRKMHLEKRSQSLDSSPQN